MQAVRYARLRSNIEKDNMTLATFVLMIISSTLFCISGVGMITLNMMKRLYGLENAWVKNHGVAFEVTDSIMRTGFAFLA
jgi:hypothetical protein